MPPARRLPAPLSNLGKVAIVILLVLACCATAFAAAAAPQAASPGAAVAGKDGGAFPLATLWMIVLDTAPAMPAAYDDARAYVALKADPDRGFPQMRLTAISLANGSTKWTREIAPIDTLAASTDTLFTTTGSELQALSNGDGAPRWHATLPAPLCAPLHPVEGSLIAATQSSDVIAFRAADGARLWQLHLPSPATGEPAVFGDALYLPLTDNRVLRVRLDTGAIVWDRTILSQPAVIRALEDRVFVGTSERWFYTLEPKDGRVLWRASIGSAVTGSPVTDRSRVYFLALDNLLRALDRAGGSLKWRQMLTRRARFGPLLVADLLFVSGFSPTIQGYAAATGAPAGSFDAPHDLKSPIHVLSGLIARDFLIVALTGEGELMAIRPQSLEPERFAPSPRAYLITGFPIWRL